jgi:simple sugar transport system ATP-binding protein
MRRLAERGVALVFVTHKLREAYALGDRISVLRLGRLVGELPPARLKAMSEREATDAVIEMMFGAVAQHERDAELLIGRGRRVHRSRSVDRSGAPRLQVRGLITAARGERALRGVDFELWPGEVLGIAGIDGNGQKHLAEVLAGQRTAASGTILLDGVDVTADAVPERRRRGIRYVTDERVGEGIVGSFSVATNLVLKEIGNAPFFRSGFCDWDHIHAYARDTIRNNDIRTPSEKTQVAKLSGGNIQKVLLARELNAEASVVIFNKPTYGLDLQNTRLAHERILAGADQGLATMVISTDLDELLEISDRVAVLSRGRVAGIVPNEPGAAERVGELMVGDTALEAA